MSRHLAVVRGWDAALATFEEESHKPALDEVMQALEDRIVSHTDAGVSFYCPLHDDGGKPSGWLKVSSDPTDPGSYSARCYACEGDSTGWWADFCTWVRTGVGEGSWSSKEATSLSPRTGSRQSGARHRHCERWYDYRDADGNLVGRKFRFVVTETREDFSSWAGILLGKSFSWDTELPLRGA